MQGSLRIEIEYQCAPTERITRCILNLLEASIPSRCLPQRLIPQWKTQHQSSGKKQVNGPFRRQFASDALVCCCRAAKTRFPESELVTRRTHNVWHRAVWPDGLKQTAQVTSWDTWLKASHVPTYWSSKTDERSRIWTTIGCV